MRGACPPHAIQLRPVSGNLAKAAGGYTSASLHPLDLISSDEAVDALGWTNSSALPA